MTRIIRLLLTVALFVVVQPFVARAAIDNGDGTVTLEWSVEYIPFSWKFNIDPPLFEDGMLSMRYDPARAMFDGINISPTQDPFFVEPDYDMFGQVSNDVENGILNIKFTQKPNATGDSGIVFNVRFSDRQPELVPDEGAFFEVFANPETGDGFNCGLSSGPADCSITPSTVSFNNDGAQGFVPTPEPGSLALVSVGALALLAFRRRR